MAGLASYAFLNARLRTKLSKLLSAEKYEQLTRAADVEGAYHVLRETGYTDIFRDMASAADVARAEAALVDHLIQVHREVAAHCKGEVRRFIEELMRKYEVENLKAVLRAWNTKEEVRFVYRAQICNEIPVDSMLKAATIEEIIVLLGETPYRKPLAGGREKYKETGSLFYLEVALDRELYAATLRAIEELSMADRRIAAKLIGIEIDILNINWIVRFKRYYNLGLAEITNLMMPGGVHIREELVREVYPGRDQASLMSALLGGISGAAVQRIGTEREVEALNQLEAFLREMYARQLRKALGGYPFTIGTAIAYLRLKRIEVSNIITLLNAKALKLPTEEIERNLVYVR